MSHWYWDISGGCERPVEVVVQPGNPAREKFRDATRVHPHRVDMHVRCRRCVVCLRQRRREWYRRALVETASARRTWFVTLTFAPEQHVRIAYGLDKDDFAKLGVGANPDHVHFSKVEGRYWREVSHWLKRVRKESGAALRYAMVCEPHKEQLAGMPHYHGLIHECGEKPVVKRTLQGQWHCGFSSAKLVEQDARAVGYTCKYLSKEIVARVRASVKYGRDWKFSSGSVVMDYPDYVRNAQESHANAGLDLLGQVIDPLPEGREQPPLTPSPFMKGDGLL